MKIFAKRKRKTELPAAVEKTFQSDAIVEELLQQDPTSWNAKQRRLVKRYQDRKQRESALATDGSGVPTEESQKEIVQGAADSKESGNDDDSSSSDSENDESEGGDPSPEGNPPPGEGDPSTAEATKIGSEAHDETNPLNPTTDNELKEMLDKLNSKQRRKLMRLLERDGDIEAVRTEVTSLLAGGIHKSDETATSDLPPPKKKRRKGGKELADLSKLPPDERMRREEQRRLQQEAAEARKSGDASSKFKHALNSERRRANRRKPKWESKSQTAPNEHDSSGYHMRKITGGKPDGKK